MYALDRTTREIGVPFEALTCRFKRLKFPKALACALYYRKEWKYTNCARVYDDTAITPYKHKRQFVTHFVYHVLHGEELLQFGRETNNLRVIRWALKTLAKTARTSSRKRAR